MAEMLEANLLWYATDGATLPMQRGAVPGSFDVVLAQPINVHKGTAVTELQRVFDNMCLVALDWKTRLDNPQDHAEATSWPGVAPVTGFPGLA